MLCLWSDQSEFMTISYGVSLQCVLDFYFCQSCGCYNFSIDVFLLLPVGFICSQAHILNKPSVSMVSSD
jgi:hypothetical protein